MEKEIEPWKIGELVYNKQYKEAIELGLKLLKNHPTDCMVHINLMDAYFKGRELSDDYFDKSTYHAKMAILYGHCTGCAHLRLAKNLESKKFYHQALQLYSLILDKKGFRFSVSGMGNSVDFAKRKDNVYKKLSKALDTNNDVLFSKEEIVKIILRTKRKHFKDKYYIYYQKFYFDIIKKREKFIFKLYAYRYKFCVRALKLFNYSR